jgi:ATP-dependent DNA helicase RecQ
VSEVSTEQAMASAHAALKEHFGYDCFRPGQETLVEAILSGRDCLGVMPTGAGKSICYQIPGVVLPGLTLVVSPLVSLMGDQVRALLDAGVRGSYLNSTLTPGQQNTVMRRALAGTYDIMYVAPERLSDPRFVEFASQANIPLVAIDEAHCVSQWGQDFRPAYLGIGEFIAALPKRPIVAALTATATEKVREDIVSLLGLQSPETVVTGFDRPNLHFAVEQLPSKRKLTRIVAYALKHPQDSGIVYCSTRKDVEKVQEALVEAGVAAVRYHAGLSVQERTDSQQAFVVDDAPVMVATNAFGMGIDKSNVRYVIHHNMPGSLEAYYQEAGRAGRDGEPSECLLLWNDGDIGTCRFFIEQEVENEALTPEERELVRASQRRLLAAMTGYCLTTRCLRGHILEYFGDDGAVERNNCSNCEGSYQAVDVTQQARAVMRCVQELRGRFGKSVVADVLHGSKSQRIFEFGLESSRTYGALPNDSAARIKEIIEILASEGYLQIGEGRYPLVGLGLRAREAAVPEVQPCHEASA